MQKIDKKPLRFLLFSCLLGSFAFSQAKSGLENYNLLNNDNGYMWMPVGHYRSPKGIHAEVRYNYEDVKTFSLYGGKNFSGGKKVKYSVTPMLGYSFGQFEGYSIASNTDLEWKGLYFSSQTQYSFSTRIKEEDFFFSWSETGVSITEKIFAGVAIQYTAQKSEVLTETGFVVGFDLGNFSIPLYILNPFNDNKYYILGLNYEFKVRKKRS